jgi:hypothetical protein
MLVAGVGIFVVAGATPKAPRTLNTYVPTYRPPTTTFRFFPTGEVLPSFPAQILPSYNFTVTGPITVQEGDTLGELARCHLTTVADLQDLNDLGDSTDLKVGQTLLVPNAFLGCR